MQGGVPQQWHWRFYLEGPSLPGLRPLLDAINLAYIAVPWGNPFVGGGGYELAATSDLNLFRSATVWPRAFFVDRVVPYATLPELLEWIQQAEGHPLAAVAQAEVPPRAPTGDLAGRTAQAAATYAFSTNSTAFTLDAPRAGVAVLTEAYMPGAFRVTINGAPAPYFRVNHAFKGVVLPAAGRYRITFTYQPKVLNLSLGLAAAGLGLGLAALFAARHPRPLTP